MKRLRRKSGDRGGEKRLWSVIIKPSPENQEYIRSLGGSELKDGVRGTDLMKRPEMNYETVTKLAPADSPVPQDVAEQVEIQVKYEGYIENPCSKWKS